MLLAEPRQLLLETRDALGELVVQHGEVLELLHAERFLRRHR